MERAGNASSQGACAEGVGAVRIHSHEKTVPAVARLIATLKFKTTPLTVEVLNPLVAVSLRLAA